MAYRRGGRQECKEVGMQLWGIEYSREGDNDVGLWLWSFERWVEMGARQWQCGYRALRGVMRLWGIMKVYR